MTETIDFQEQLKRRSEKPVPLARDYGLVPDGQLGAKPPPSLIKHTIPKRGLVLVAGQSRSGKTFVTLRMAVELARSRAPDEKGDFLGRRVRERVGVIYVLTEGAYSVDARMKAVKLALGITEDLAITFVRFPPGNLLIAKERKAFIAALVVEAERIKAVFGVRTGAVIIDTVTAGCAIKNEGDNSEISEVTKILREFGTELQAVTIAVHHLGKNAESGPRGASSWIDKVEAIVTVTADIDELTGKVSDRRIATTKNRDSETGPLCRFDLIKVDLCEVDEDGDAIDSCTIEVLEDEGGEDAPAAPKRPKPPSKYAKPFRDAFNEALHLESVWHRPHGNGPRMKAVPVLRVRAEFMRYLVGAQENAEMNAAARRKAWERALDDATLPDGSEYSAETVGDVGLIWRKDRQPQVEA